jgi:hypothetical protein
VRVGGKGCWEARSAADLWSLSPKSPQLDDHPSLLPRQGAKWTFQSVRRLSILKGVVLEVLPGSRENCVGNTVVQRHSGEKGNSTTLALIWTFTVSPLASPTEPKQASSDDARLLSTQHAPAAPSDTDILGLFHRPLRQRPPPSITHPASRLPFRGSAAVRDETWSISSKGWAWRLK